MNVELSGWVGHVSGVTAPSLADADSDKGRARVGCLLRSRNPLFLPLGLHWQSHLPQHVLPDVPHLAPPCFYEDGCRASLYDFFRKDMDKGRWALRVGSRSSDDETSLLAVFWGSSTELRLGEPN